MIKKIIQNGYDLQSSIIEVCDTIYNVVGSTMGPQGRTVMRDKGRITKDGKTVMDWIEFQDPKKQGVFKIIASGTAETNTKAGDGTTSSSILASEIIRNGVLSTLSGINPREFMEGIYGARDAAIDFLHARTKTIQSLSELQQVATLSANGDREIGDMIAEAMQKIGKDGTITVEDGRTTSKNVYLDFTDGMSIDRGSISPHFYTNQEKMTAELENVMILVTDKKISIVNQILPILENVSQSGKSLLIIADEVDGEALTALVFNKIRGVLKVAAVKAPGFGDRRAYMLEDIAILTGTQVVTDALGVKMENINVDGLGFAKKVIVGKDKTVIVGGSGSKGDIENRIAQIRSQIAQSTSDYDKEKFQERAAKLSGGIAIIRVGGSTEVEIKERKDRVDDAVSATKAASEEGILPGGGVPYFWAAEHLKSILDSRRPSISRGEAIGFEVVLNSLYVCLKRIVKNANFSPEVVMHELRHRNNTNLVFDAQNLVYVDAAQSGILDPFKVIRLSIVHAVSVASKILGSSHLIYDEIETKGGCNVGGRPDTSGDEY